MATLARLATMHSLRPPALPPSTPSRTRRPCCLTHRYVQVPFSGYQALTLLMFMRHSLSGNLALLFAGHRNRGLVIIGCTDATTAEDLLSHTIQLTSPGAKNCRKIHDCVSIK